MSDRSGVRGSGRSEFATNFFPLLGSAVGASFGLGLLTPVYSIFFRALEQEFHWTKATAAVSMAGLALTALALPLIGKLLDRFGVVPVALGSTLGLSASLVGLSMMNGTLAQYYAISAALAVLGVGAGPISYTRVIAHSFDKSRGLALALTLAGGAVTGMIVPILVSNTIASDGWRDAYRLLAVLALAGGLLAVTLIRGHHGKPATTRSWPSSGRSAREALGMRAFWVLSGVLLLTSVASIGFFSQLQSIATEKGLSRGEAEIMISLLALSVIPTRLLVGWALDVVDPRIAGAAALTLAAGGMIVVLLAPQGAFWIFAVGVVMISASIGAEFDLMSFFCAYCFGLKNYASIFGLLMSSFYVGFAAGGVGYGMMHDSSGDYLTAIGASAAFLMLASLLVLALPSERFAREPDLEFTSA